MDITAAWDAVLAIQTDIAAIVSQAVRAGRVCPDYTTNDGISYCVELLVSTQELILDAGRYALASLRRELRYDDKAVTDALERTTVDIAAVPETALGENSANRPVAEPQGEIAVPEYLNPLQKRVARSLAAGKGIWRTARECGMSPHAVRIIAGQVAGRMEGEGKK